MLRNSFVYSRTHLQAYLTMIHILTNDNRKFRNGNGGWGWGWGWGLRVRVVGGDERCLHDTDKYYFIRGCFSDLYVISRYMESKLVWFNRFNRRTSTSTSKNFHGCYPRAVNINKTIFLRKQYLLVLILQS